MLSFIESENNYGYILINIGTTKENVDEVKDITLKEIDKIKSLKEEELKHVKEQLIGTYELNKESCENVAIALLKEELAGNAENYYKYKEYVNAIKLEDVRKIAKINGYSFAAVIPKD